MKFRIYLAASFMAKASLSSSFAQFDFGGLIEGRAQQAIQRLENRVQQHLPQILPHVPRHETFPIPPHVATLPYPQPNHPVPQPYYQEVPFQGTVQMNLPHIVHKSVATNPGKTTSSPEPNKMARTVPVKFSPAKKK